MTTQATYDDVNLVLKLYELRRETKLRAAREWFSSTFRAHTLEELDQTCPQGSETSVYFRMVVSYWEMVASFLTGGVLHEELFYQSGGEMLLVWEKIKDLLPDLRQRYANPLLYRNLEQAAGRYIRWLNQQAPGAYENFAARLRGA
ncbi:MAG: DUF4760 domain-containing protein [Bryobacteraceae bacterium]